MQGSQLLRQLEQLLAHVEARPSRTPLQHVSAVWALHMTLQLEAAVGVEQRAESLEASKAAKAG